MLLSMTGYGDARHQSDRLNLAVEIRAVNNRYLKVSTKCPDTYAPLEHRIEKLVRESIARGTVNITLRFDRSGGDERYKLDSEVLARYWNQLEAISRTSVDAPQPDLGALLQLPGVVVERESDPSASETVWPVVRDVMQQALRKLQSFRAAEGNSMEQELRANCATIAAQLEEVAKLAPEVVRDYRDRLVERVRELLSGTDMTIGSPDLMREVSIFAERCDINEEITRLRSHLEQIQTFFNQQESQGRRLEFLAQEMFREVNTIGSKANNVAIAHCVVEMKATVEKMREILQNVE